MEYEQAYDWEGSAIRRKEGACGRVVVIREAQRQQVGQNEKRMRECQGGIDSDVAIGEFEVR